MRYDRNIMTPNPRVPLILLVPLLGAGILLSQNQKVEKPPKETPPAVLSVLPAPDLADFWRTSNDVTMAQMNLERTPQADQLKTAMQDRQKVIDRLVKACGPEKVLNSADPDQAARLGVKEGTPVCVPPLKASSAPVPVASKPEVHPN